MSPEAVTPLLHIEYEDSPPTDWPARPSERWFDLPHWVPRPVSHIARALYEELAELGADDDLELVRRLATDERLKFVWRELEKPNRSQGNSTYLHPGNPSAQALNWIGRPLGRNTHQAAAMAELFREMVLYAMYDLPALMRKPLPHRKYPTWTARARELRAWAADLNGPRMSSHREGFLEAASACDELAREPPRCPKCGAQPPSWDDEADRRRTREVVEWVGSTCRRLFGSTMYNTVAAIVSAIIDREITRASIREWLS
jgi:hypothetical protein